MRAALNTMEESKKKEQKGGRMLLVVCRSKNEYIRVALAETLSTFVMMVFGLGSVAQVVTGGGLFGDYLSINLGFGLGVAMGVHIAGKISDAIFHYCGGNFTVSGPRATAGIFATFPADYLSIPTGFFDQVLGTAMLMLCLVAMSDQQNWPASPGAQPLAVGLLVLLIGVSLGSNSGYAINPSRDLAPRIFTALAGWGMEVFRAGNSWWWVPVMAPLVGGVVGATVYKVLVELHQNPDPEPDSTGVELLKADVSEACV